MIRSIDAPALVRAHVNTPSLRPHGVSRSARRDVLRSYGTALATFAMLLGGTVARAADLALPPPPLAPVVEAPDYGRLTLTEENDGLLPDHWDRHYTQGAMLTYLSPSVRPEDFAAHLFDGVSANTPFFQPGADVRRKFDIVVGQSIFTPVRYHDVPPNPNDRPFAGWLFTGGSLLQDTGGTMLENIELLGGVVGPDSLGKDAQIAVHKLLGFNNQNLDQTWRYQLHNEPGFMLTYERRWRLWQGSLYGIESDFIPEAGFTAGNIMTYASAGATFRVGQNLNVDYGIQRIRPAPSGTAWFDASRLNGDFGWYLFAAVEGRAVAHNIFLDGNSFTDSRSVEKNIGVGDFSAGASVFYRDWAKFDVSFTERSKEFKTQAQADHFGQASLSFRF